MPGFTYTPIDGQEIDLSLYVPGFKSSVAGRWGRHPIPGQKGDLKEDLGDGSLKTRVRLQFVGETQADYDVVIPAMSKSRRGTLLHPRRGARSSVITNIEEEVVYTERGDSTLVDVDFEDAVIGQADSFRAGPSARAQQVNTQADEAESSQLVIQRQAFSRPDLEVRALAVIATAQVKVSTDAARAYAAAAQESFSIGIYDPAVQAQLKGLPPLVQVATQAIQQVGPAADTQDTIMALEVMLFAATQLDAAIRAAQPIPISTTVTRSPGQSVYAFVQQHYGRSGKTPSEMRNLVSLILRLNRQIRRPALIPVGTKIVRPVA